MTLLDDIEEFFGTKNLYQVVNVDKDATTEQVKKAYRKASLKIHPDRVPESEKDKATKKFQVLAQVHYVLSDEEKRKLYDNHGVIANDEGLESEADWSNYWRLLFPKISEKDIQTYLDSYVGTKEEEEDLITLYNRYQGDLDKISETHIAFNEEETTNLLKKLIKEKKIPNYSKFSKESQSRKDKRQKRANKEAKQAEKFKDELKSKTGKDLDNIDDLTALIRKKSQGGFDSMIASLEAKYANGNKGVKRKRSNR